MPHVQIDGLYLPYDDLGQGEPALLFLPGWCASRAAFGDLPGLASAYRRVLAMDWRGHGAADTPAWDFGHAELAADALAVIARSGARQVVPVALGHAGWIALELRRRLGSQVAGLVLIDWELTPPPAHFLAELDAMQASDPVGRSGFAQWALAARALSGEYRRAGCPLADLAALGPAVPTLHLSGAALPADTDLALQQFAQRHPWFTATQLPSRGPLLVQEMPATLAEHIVRFTVPLPGPGADRQPRRRAG